MAAIAKLQAVRDACEVHPELRTKIHVDAILDFVKDVSFFAGLSLEQQRSLGQAMTLEAYRPRETIFKTGDIGDKYYIILTGGVNIIIPATSAACPRQIHKSGECTCPERSVETAIPLERGAGFGELALQYSTTRTATAITIEATELLITTREDYERDAGAMHREYIEQRLDFLSKCTGISDAMAKGIISLSDVRAVANCLAEKHLSGNAVLCSQGDEVERIVFVRTGRLLKLRTLTLESPVKSPTHRGWQTERSAVKAPQEGFQWHKAAVHSDDEIDSHRTTSVEDPDHKGGKVASRQSVPTYPSSYAPQVSTSFSMAESIGLSLGGRSTSSPRRRLLALGTIGPFQHFGYQQLLRNEVYPVSLVSDPLAEVYLINKYDIMRRLPKPVLSILFDDQQHQVPMDFQIIQIHRQTERWEAYRRAVQNEALGKNRLKSLDSTGQLERDKRAQEKLMFLGMNVDNARSTLRSRHHTVARLTEHEEEAFSDMSAQQFRRIEALRRDPGVQEALAKAGLRPKTSANTSTCSLGSTGFGESTLFEMQWARVAKDAVSFDLDNLDSLPQPTFQPAESSGIAWRPGDGRGKGGTSFSGRGLQSQSRGGAASSRQGRRTVGSRTGGRVTFQTAGASTDRLGFGHSFYAEGEQGRPSAIHSASRPPLVGSGLHLPALVPKG